MTMRESLLIFQMLGGLKMRLVSGCYLYLSTRTTQMFAVTQPRLHPVPPARWLERRKKALVEERVMDKASCHLETHGDVDNQIKKARIEGMKSIVNKIDIEVMIAQVQIMRANEEILIGSLSKKQ
jgi:hypothetical protein